nr:hypothetical protein [Lujinxingiaceae bacterium]
FMGNHFHLLCRAPRMNLGEFMRDFQSWLATKLQQHWKTTSQIFSRRYSAVDLLDDATAFDKLIYLLANPCAAALVQNPKDYPGLSSLPYHLDDQPICGRWVTQEKLTRNLKRNKDYDPELAASYHSIRLTPLPSLEPKSAEQRASTITQELAATCAALHKKRGKKGVLGARRLQRLDPKSRPKAPKFTPCPTCLSTQQAKKDAHKAHRQAVTASYYRARSHDRNPQRQGPAHYPVGTTPPGHQKCVAVAGSGTPTLRGCRGVRDPDFRDPDFTGGMTQRTGTTTTSARPSLSTWIVPLTLARPSSAW